MTDELFKKAEDLRYKIYRLERVKVKLKESKFIYVDTLPFADEIESGVVEAIKVKCEEAAKEIREEFERNIDRHITALNEEYKAL